MTVAGSTRWGALRSSSHSAAASAASAASAPTAIQTPVMSARARHVACRLTPVQSVGGSRPPVLVFTSDGRAREASRELRSADGRSDPRRARRADAGELAKRWAIALIEKAGPDAFARRRSRLHLPRGRGADRARSRLRRARDGEAPAQDTRARALAGAGSPAELARARGGAARRCSGRRRSKPRRGRARSARAARRLCEMGDRLAGACAELLARELEALRSTGQRPGAGGTAPRLRAGPGRRPTRIVIVDERGAEADRAGAEVRSREPTRGRVRRSASRPRAAARARRRSPRATRAARVPARGSARSARSSRLRARLAAVRGDADRAARGVRRRADG